MALENREAQYLNRRKLEVVSTTKDTSGNIKELVVDVKREEGVVSKQGTILNAENLTREVENIVVKKMNNQTGTTSPIYEYSNKVATTKFVWDVLISLGYNVPNPNPGGGSGGGTSS